MDRNILQTDDVLKKFVETVVSSIKRDLKPTKLIIFGSRVRGDARDDSDIDVIIVSELFEGIPFVKRMSMVLQKIHFSRHLDFICYTPEEFESIQRSSTVIKSALQEGLAA